MTHDPLIRIDILREKARKGGHISVEDLDAVRADINCAVCFFLRLRERGALQAHSQIANEIDMYLGSQEPNDKVDAPSGATAERR
jgi:hypothetical protein